MKKRYLAVALAALGLGLTQSALAADDARAPMSGPSVSSTTAGPYGDTRQNADAAATDPRRSDARRLRSGSAADDTTASGSAGSSSGAGSSAGAGSSSGTDSLASSTGRDTGTGMGASATDPTTTNRGPYGDNRQNAESARGAMAGSAGGAGLGSSAAGGATDPTTTNRGPYGDNRQNTESPAPTAGASAGGTPGSANARTDPTTTNRGPYGDNRQNAESPSGSASAGMGPGSSSADAGSVSRGSPADSSGTRGAALSGIAPGSTTDPTTTVMGPYGDTRQNNEAPNALMAGDDHRYGTLRSERMRSPYGSAGSGAPSGGSVSGAR